MIVYFSVLTMLLFLFTVRQSNLVQSNKARNAIYWIAWVMLLLVVGLRYNVGTDYKYYRYNYFNRYSYTWYDILSGGNEAGLSVVSWLSHAIYDDYATWFFIMAIIAIVPCAILIQRESVAPCLSTVLFVVLGCWHTSFNIVSQCAAIGILAFGYRYLLERSFWRWCLVCLFASAFHITTLVMIPVYFFASTRISWKRILFLVIVAIAIILTYDELFALMKALSGDAMTESVDSNFGSDQINIFRVLVNCAPVIMATCLLRFYDKNNGSFCVLYNLSLFNAVLNVGTMNSAYLNRFALYTIFYNVLFIPYLVKPFKRNTRIFIWCIMIALYALFWAYDLYKCPDTVNFYWIFERGV